MNAGVGRVVDHRLRYLSLELPFLLDRWVVVWRRVGLRKILVAGSIAGGRAAQLVVLVIAARPLVETVLLQVNLVPVFERHERAVRFEFQFLRLL